MNYPNNSCLTATTKLFKKAILLYMLRELMTLDLMLMVMRGLEVLVMAMIKEMMMIMHD